MKKGCEYALVDNVSLNHIDNGLVIFNEKTGAIYGLDRLGADFIKAIQLNSPISLAIRQIAERYQVDYPKIDSQIDQLIFQLLDQNLLRKTV